MQPLHLESSNDSRHASIVHRTESAIEELQATGKRITFYSVADKAQVSRSTLYRCDELRKLVEEARAKTASNRAEPASRDDRIAELERELAQMSREREELRCALRRVPAIRYAIARIPRVAQMAEFRDS